MLPALIVGGFASIGMGIALERAGLDFVVLEAAQDVGGTWRDNVYPGVAVDTPSFTHSFSFEQRPTWSRVFDEGRELHDYAHHCVEKYGLGPHIRYGAKLAEARYRERDGTWQVRLADGGELVTRTPISATGLLTQPTFPARLGGRGLAHEPPLPGHRLLVPVRPPRAAQAVRRPHLQRWGAAGRRAPARLVSEWPRHPPHVQAHLYTGLAHSPPQESPEQARDGRARPDASPQRAKIRGPMPQKPARRDLQPDRSAERRAHILQAAYDAFAERGYRDTTVADIAQRLGIGHGTFYRTFENKHDVFEQVLMAGLGRVARVIATPASNIDTLEQYRTQVRTMGADMLALLESDQALPRLLLYEVMGISPELDEKIQRMWEMAGTITEAYLHNGKAKGFLRDDLDVQVTALAVNAMIFEAGRRVVRASQREVMRARWLDGLTRLMFDGIRAR